MSRGLMALVLGMALVCAIAAIAASHRSTVRCTEDMPCWNCETMGNRICGPGVTP